MSLVSEILEAQNSIVEGVLAEDPLTESTFNVLPDAQQRYLSGIGVDLGYDSDDLRTEEDWKALDEGEAKRLQQETEELFYEQSTLNALIGGDIAKTELMARELAEESLIDGRYDQAAGVSATRQRWAEADVANNDEFRLAQQDSMKELQRVQENEAVMIEFQQKLEKKAKDSSWWTFTKDFVGTAPGIEAWRYKQAINVLGLERIVDFSKGDLGDILKKLGNTADASTYKKIFAAAMNSIAYDDGSVDFQRLSSLMKKIEETWDDKGINPYVQADLMKQALDYSPSFSTFNAATLPLVGVQASKFVGRAGLAASKGLWINAGGQVAKAAGEVAGIPFSEAAVNVAERGVTRLARRLRPSSDLGVTLEKALATKNRAIISEVIESNVGKPTDTAYAVRATKEGKDDYITYFVDDIVSPTASPNTSLANDPQVIARKIDKARAEELKKAIQNSSRLQDIQTVELTKLYNRVAESLDITHLEGIGRGNAGEKIVGLSDIMFTKNDNIDFVVRLGDKGGPLSPRMSVIKNGVDVGRKRAEKDGQAFVKAIKSTSDSPYAKWLDYKVDLYKLDNDTGAWKVSLVIPTNKGFGTIFYNSLVEQGLMKQKDWRPLWSGLFTATSNPSDIRMADALREIDGAMVRSTGKAVQDSFKDLSKKDRALVQALMDISTKYEAWYKTEELLARGVSEAAADVYSKAKMLNDYSEFVRNKYMRASLVTKGAKRVSFNNKTIEGAVRPITDYHTASELEAKIGNRGVLVDSIEGIPMILDTDEIKDCFNKGYVLIEPSISPDATIAAKSFYYLLNPQSTTVNELGAFVTTYVAGGRRFFQRDASYVKQLIMRDTGVAGRQSIVGVQTFFTDLDGMGLTKRTEALNTARDLYMQGKMDECTKFIAEQGWYKAPFHNAQEFYEYFSQRGMDFANAENRLEVVAGKNTLKSYDYYKTLDNVDDLVGFEGMQEFARNSHYQAITNEEKVRRMSRSGRELLTWDFEAAEPVDFEMQMRYIVNDMVQDGVMGSFTDFYAERFAKSFNGIIENKGKTELTPREMLFGHVKEGLTGGDAVLAKQAETAQKNYAMIRGIPSKIDTAIAEKGREFFEWIVEGSSKNLYLSDQAAHRARVLWNELTSKNYLQTAREFASQYTMGLFNVSQFWKQAAQDVSIFLMDPLSAKVAGDSFRLVPIMMKAGGDRVLAEKLAREAFKADPDMLNTALNIIDMGFFEHGTAGGFIARGESVRNRFNKLSYLPFNAGEMQARLLAGLTSLKRNNLYGVRATADQLKGPLTYAHSLFMNMDGSGISRLQKSEIASTIMQFQSPRLRFIETMLFDKNLTGKQKACWAIGLASLVGTEGILGVTASSWITTNIYNMFHSIEDTELPALEDRNEIMRLVQRGLLNYASETAGIGTDFSQLAGAPEILEPLDYFFGAPSLGNIVSFEVPYKAVKEGFRLAKVSYNSFFGEATGDDFLSALEVATQNAAPSSVKKPVLAFLMYNTGVRLNSKGELSERMNGMLESVLYGLGFGRLSDKDMAKYYVDLRDYSQRMKAIEDEGYPTFMQWLNTGSVYYRKQTEDYLKFSDLNNMDRAKVLKKWTDQAAEKKGLTNVERGILNQYRTGGSSGNNLINLKQ